MSDVTALSVTVTPKAVKGCRVCGGEVAPYNLRRRVYLCRTCKRTFNRPYDARYHQTENRRESWRAYRQTEKGRACTAQYNRRLIRIGERRVGIAETIAQAQAINAHIRQRLQHFKGRHCGPLA